MTSTISIFTIKSRSSQSTSTAIPKHRSYSGGFFLSIPFLVPITSILVVVIGLYFYYHKKSSSSPSSSSGPHPVLEGEDIIETEAVLEDERIPLTAESQE